MVSVDCNVKLEKYKLMLAFNPHTIQNGQNIEYT